MTNDVSRPAMESEGLVKKYKGSVKALDGASFSIGKGESVGYLGPNGAGKSTTIKIFTTLIRPTHGRAFIDGYDVISEPKKALANTGSLVEVPGLYDYLTPREMLGYMGKVYGLHKRDLEERVESIMRNLGLADWIDKKLRTFSTGMRRRYSIGQAVIHDPELVILDEPVLGLDPAGIRDIRHFLQKLKAEGKTVFLSSHLLGEVEEVCDRVLLINKGLILAEVSLADLKKSTAGGYLVIYPDAPPKDEVAALS
ncbi:MAG: ABC transporter ATP-binding protein, partial [Thermoplasmata archaeon]|nr:ABC transporter ATP-binding protein [Thermoplasmata archaeon]